MERRGGKSSIPDALLNELKKIILELRELAAEVHTETIILHLHSLLVSYNLTKLLKTNGGKFVLGKVWASRFAKKNKFTVRVGTQVLNW